jgi:hypothetical protein
VACKDCAGSNLHTAGCPADGLLRLGRSRSDWCFVRLINSEELVLVCAGGLGPCVERKDCYRLIWTARTTTWAAHLSRRLTLSVSFSQVPFCSAIACTFGHLTALLSFCVPH